jgi:hypothetical protein
MTRTFLPIMFDGKQHVGIAVPSFMTVQPSPADELIVEGRVPDSSWKVDHHVRITFFIIADKIAGDKIKRTCKKSERYAYGPISRRIGQRVGHGGWCRTDWVLQWLSQGLT